MKLTKLHEELVGYANQALERGVPLDTHDHVSHKLMQQDKYLQTLKRVLNRSKWPINIIIISEYLNLDKDEIETHRRQQENFRSSRRENLYWELRHQENLTPEEQKEYQELEAEYKRLNTTQEKYQTGPQIRNYKKGIDSYFTNYINQHKKDNAINLVIYSNVGAQAGGLKGQILTPWMLLHQIGEHLLDSSTNLFNKEDFYGWRSGGRLWPQPRYRFKTKNGKEITATYDDLINMCRSRASKSHIESDGDELAE